MESNLRILQSFKKINEKINDNEEKQKEINREIDDFLKDISERIKEIDNENQDLKKELSQTIEKVKQEKPKDGKDGKDGRDGKDGYTPVKGKDYFDGKDGADGLDGKNGVDGKNGKDGQDGRNGIDGKDGKNGIGIYNIEININGELIIILTDKRKINCGVVVGRDGFGYNGNDGVSVTDAKIIDGELVITLSTGRKINAGKVVGEGGTTIETDPVFTKSPAYSITNQDIENWNNKVEDSNYVHTDNNFTNELKNQITTDQKRIDNNTEKISKLDKNKASLNYVDSKVKMFHAKIDNSNFQYVKGSADFTYEDVVNTEDCIIETQVANERVYLKKQEFKNINPPDSIAGRYVGFSEIIRVAGEMAELFLFVYDPNNLPTDEASLDRLKDWGDYQYCQSSYQPIMMGNFLGKNIYDERNRDNLAPSMKAVGDYTDAQCGVVLDYMQTTFADNILTLAGLKRPVPIYYNAEGFEASNSNIGDDWHLTGLDLSPYKRLKFYVKSAGSTNDNYTPSHIVEMYLDPNSKSYKDFYVAGHTSQNPNNANRLHNVTFAVNAEKTAVQFARATSLYGTASTASKDGRTCYLIEGYYD
jgi:exonuclease VII large subunit